MRLGHALADTVIARHKKRLSRRTVRRITVDMDPAADLTHGQQQLSLFNAHYGAWCYLPVHGFLQFDDESEQYLFASVLRDGHAGADEGACAILERVIGKLGKAFPRSTIRVRLDGGFATPEVLDFLDEAGVEYVVAIAGNRVLQAHAEHAMVRVRARSEASGESEQDFAECYYAAGSWDTVRRVVIKAEVVRLGERAMRDNPRFVLTNLRQTPRFVYESVYCARGAVENRIKELVHGLDIDRTSCHRFFANQLRVLLTAAAYVSVPGAALECAAHLARRRPGEHVARASAQARRLGGGLDTTDGAALAGLGTVATGVVPDRPGARCRSRLIESMP